MTKKIGKLKVHCSRNAVAFRWGEGKIHRLSLDRFKRDQADMPDDSGSSASYADEYSSQGYQAGRYSNILYSNDWLMYALLVVFPPLGIWILWKRERLTPVVRAVVSVLSAIWFIIMLIWLFSALLNTGGSDAIATPTPAPYQQTQADDATRLIGAGDVDVVATPNPTPKSSTTVLDDETGSTTGGTTASNTTGAADTADNETDSSGTTYCYSAPSGTYYHSKADCPDIDAGATRVSLQLARQRSQTNCPTCYDTAGTTASANFYIASSGKYYHSSKSCSRIAGKSVTALTQSAAVQAGKTACPTCIGAYWHTKGGKYYHAKEHCSGMSSATRVTKKAAQNAGQKPCPVCIGGKSAASAATTATKYYATAKGKYYHVKKTCSGMTNAKETTLAAAKKKGQKACPVCLAASKTASSSSGTGNYYATRNGTYYHTKSACSGMKDATKITLASAKKAGKKPCPVCVSTSVPASLKKSSTTSNSAAATSNKNVTYYYAKPKGNYYHKNSTCSGMTGAKKVTKATAVKNGFKPCPVCLSAQATKVYSTTGGKYYHKTRTCSGMKNARSTTLAKAINQGKIACPVCYKSASSKATFCYSTSTNKYYHLKKNCSGMINATKMTVATAKKKGKSACPVCAAKQAATQYFFVTKDNKYYHNKSNCSGMTGASKATLAQAKKAGKTACPVCVTKTIKPAPTPNAVKKVYCFASSGSKYYHKQKKCSGLKNAKKVLLSKAKAAGKTACPICVTKTISSTTQTTSYANKKTVCYASGASAYYHKDANCVAGLKKTTVAAAKKKGKAPCPSCAAGLNTYVYVTKNGLKYHRKSTCSGNLNPYKISLATAIKQNYTRCTKCNAPKAK